MKSLKELINDIFNLHNRKELENIRKDPAIIKEIANPTEAQQLAAIRSSSHIIRYIKEPTKKVRFTALKDNIYNYPYIKNLTEKEQLYLVKQGIGIENIKNPVEKVQLYALQWRRASISDIKNPTEKAQLITIKKDKELFLYIKNPTIDVCQKVAKAYCGNIVIPADRKIIKPTKKLVHSLQELEGYVHIKEMSIDYNKGNKYINNESDKIMNWKEQKQKQIIDNYKYEIGITKEKGIEPNIKIEESSIQQEYGNKEVKDFLQSYSQAPSLVRRIKVQSRPRLSKTAKKSKLENPANNIEHKNSVKEVSPEQYILEEKKKIFKQYAINPYEPFSSRNISAEGRDKWAEVNNKYMNMKTSASICQELQSPEIVGRILFYGFDGKVGEVMEYDNAACYLEALEYELFYNPDGFNNETISTDPYLRKTVDDLIYDYCGGSNPYSIEHYEQQSSIPTSSSTNEQILQSSECRTLISEIGPDKQISGYHILDKSTGKTEPLHVSDINLSKQSPEALKKLLSGQQAEMTTKSGITQMMGLSKSPAGWTLQVGKQIFNMADSSAEI